MDIEARFRALTTLLRQTQSAWGRWQPGQIRPLSVL